MSCPTCKILMESGVECHRCPQCKGEFFSSKTMQKAEMDPLWLYMQTIYSKALRDEKATNAALYKHGFLRSTGRGREDWDSSLGFI